MPPEEAEPGERERPKRPRSRSPWNRRRPTWPVRSERRPGPQSAAPYMIGDFFGGSACQVTIVRSFAFNNLVGAVNGDGRFYTVIPERDASTRVAVHDLMPDQGGPPYPITGVNDASGQLGGPPLESVPAGGYVLGRCHDRRTKPGDISVHLAVPDGIRGGDPQSRAPAEVWDG